SYFDVDEIVSLINYFLEKNDTINLNTVIELGYELHPDDTGFKIALCKTLASMEDFDSAIKLIEDINIKGNKDVDLIRLECYCELDRYDEALWFIDDLTAKGCSHLEEAIVHMACVLNDIDKYQDDAYRFIQHALTMFPDNFILKSELCFNFELRGHTKEAMELCRKLIDEDPYSAEIWYMQGRLYSTCADFEKAVDSLNFAITCIDDNQELEYEIKLMRAFCLYKNESYEEAIRCYKELISSDDFVNSQVNPYLAECYMNVNEYEKAYHILKHVIGHRGINDEVSVYGNFIYCCIETERRKEAIEVLGDALKRFPHSILEYLSTLNIIKNQEPDRYTGKENIIYPGELARKYLSSNIHNN
ncbi:MAG: multidrug transporter, partial [Tannerella sp.]|nr:multidrug transporter [Tannerella sp.]